MNHSELFTLLGFEAQRNLLHVPEELADSAYLEGYQLTFDHIYGSKPFYLSICL